ncbi:hypothetical protein DQ04_00471010 [Trypanosoma grayi]|uniref:hypothetical protein n=1 Tax=Trypanosoma grayi TaxID=71804 RepID=UPI0004F406E7|nr:hypothetical protein DQ04_00471010 [Trypanosoma grayi]KEG14427.1 hypothetical protein DQ04_00471010 [Trypanosoma grayi]
MVYFVLFSFVGAGTSLRIALRGLLQKLLPECHRLLRDWMRAFIVSVSGVPVARIAKQARISVRDKAVQYVIGSKEAQLVKVMHMIDTGNRYAARAGPFGCCDSNEDLRSGDGRRKKKEQTTFVLVCSWSGCVHSDAATKSMLCHHG